ncbi:hypothetical protein GOP47_0028568 [Adiantum capillus-veneris]|nr:hypothetical protein GOP47_0028568 [Adiantum capillus-veneris]
MSSNRSTKDADTELPLEAYISMIGEYGKHGFGKGKNVHLEKCKKSLLKPGILSSLPIRFCGEYDNARFAIAEMIDDGKTPTERTCTALLQVVVNAE